MRLSCSVFLASALAVGCVAHESNPSASSGAKSASSGIRSGPIHLTLVGTNDIHGWVYPHVTRLHDGTEVEEGGVATLGGYLKILRAKNPGGVLLLDAGDLFQGTLASNLTEGAVVVEVMNALGYTASAIGNHEFDYGPVGPVSVAQPGMDPFGALKQRMQQAKFPMLAANIYDAQTGQRPAWIGNDGTTIVEVKGLKIGIVGLITPQTPFTTNPVNVSTLRFGSLIPEALAAAKRVRERGADLVLLVAHAGTKCASLTNPHDLSSCDPTGEMIELLQGLPPRTFDAVVAGHTHAPMGHYVNGTPVIETWGMGKDFGMIDLEIDPATKKVIEDQTQIHPVIHLCAMLEANAKTCEGRRLVELAQVQMEPATFEGQKVERDAAILDILAPALANVEAEQHRSLGLNIPAPLGRNYEAESALGDLLADALREMDHADVVLLNPGGLRADLVPGELRYGELYEVLPFDNTLATVTVSGDELKRLLATAYGSKKGVFQQSGLKLKLARCPSPARMKSVVLSDGKPIVADKIYRVVMPDFLARGGDGLQPVMASLPAEQVDLGLNRPLNFRDSLVEFWQKKKGNLVAPKPGRLSFVDDGQSCPAGANLDLQAASHHP